MVPAPGWQGQLRRSLWAQGTAAATVTNGQNNRAADEWSADVGSEGPDSSHTDKTGGRELGGVVRGDVYLKRNHRRITNYSLNTWLMYLYVCEHEEDQKN